MKHKSLINILKTIIVLSWTGAGIVIGLSIGHETPLHKTSLTIAFAVVFALLSLSAIAGVETLASYIRSSRMRRNTKHMEPDTPTEDDDVSFEEDFKNDINYVRNKLFAGLGIPKSILPFEEETPGGIDECLLDCDDVFEDDKESADCETLCKQSLCKQTDLDFTNKGTKLWLLRASYEQLFNYILNNRLNVNVLNGSVIDTKGMSKNDIVKLINKVSRLKTKSFVSADYLVDLINITIDGLIHSLQANREVNQ